VCSAVSGAEAFWLGLVVGVLSTIIGGLILAALLYVIRRYPRYRREGQAEQEDKRLLWAFRELSGDDVHAALPIEKAAERAQLEDPSAAVDRLKSGGLIVPFGPPDYRPDLVRITLAGLRAAPPPSLERRWWEFWR
jgi:hypothetical protein